MRNNNNNDVRISFGKKKNFGCKILKKIKDDKIKTASEKFLVVLSSALNCHFFFFTGFDWHLLKVPAHYQPFVDSHIPIFIITAALQVQSGVRHLRNYVTYGSQLRLCTWQDVSNNCFIDCCTLSGCVSLLLQRWTAIKFTNKTLDDGSVIHILQLYEEC